MKPQKFTKPWSRVSLDSLFCHKIAVGTTKIFHEPKYSHLGSWKDQIIPLMTFLCIDNLKGGSFPWEDKIAWLLEEENL